VNSGMVLSKRTAAASRAVGIRPAYFVQHGTGIFQPTPSAAASWSDGLLSGQAIAGLASSTLERKYGAVGYLPARLTLDLLKPARAVPTHVHTRLVRHGNRMRIAECDIIQDDWIVARATMLQYRESATPGTSDVTTARSIADGDDQAHNAGRKRAYYGGLDAVAGLAATPFVRAAVVAEAAANLVTNPDTNRIGYVNGDLTVALSRLPRGVFIGVQADTNFAENGVSVGSATLFDDAGAFGTSMVTAVANPASRIDTGSRD